MSRLKPIRHGTEAGAVAHRRRGEKPCEDCLSGQLEAIKDRKAAKKGAGHTTATLEGPRKKTVRLGDWPERAACRDEPTLLFFGYEGERGPERQIREREARQICMGCPVRTDCLDYAVSRPERYGMWGGLNEDQRKAEARRRRRKTNDQPRHSPDHQGDHDRAVPPPRPRSAPAVRGIEPAPSGTGGRPAPEDDPGRREATVTREDVVMDELEARVRSLEAERLRPEPEPPAVEDALRELVRTLHAAYRTPADAEREAS